MSRPTARPSRTTRAPDLRHVTTPRLSCEALEPAHAAEMSLLLGDPRVAATLSPTGRPPAPGGTPSELAVKAAHWRRHGFGLWLLRDRASGAMVGRGGMQHTFIEGVEEVEIAWAIVPRRWREGLATELALACLQIASADLALARVIAYTRTDNIASRGVMEKAGMSLEREFVDRWGLPSVLYSQQVARPEIRAPNHRTAGESRSDPPDPVATLVSTAPLTRSREARKEHNVARHGHPRPG